MGDKRETCQRFLVSFFAFVGTFGNYFRCQNNISFIYTALMSLSLHPLPFIMHKAGNPYHPRTPPPIMGLALARVKNFICTRHCHAYGRIGCPNKVWKVERSTGWGTRSSGSGSTGAPHWPPYLTPVEHENAI